MNIPSSRRLALAQLYVYTEGLIFHLRHAVTCEQFTQAHPNCEVAHMKLLLAEAQVRKQQSAIWSIAKYSLDQCFISEQEFNNLTNFNPNALTKEIV